MKITWVNTYRTFEELLADSKFIKRELERKTQRERKKPEALGWQGGSKPGFTTYSLYDLG